jgi:spore coat protein U-like protein
LGSNNTAGIKISFSSAHANGGNFQLKSTGLANPAFIPYQLIFDRGESSTPAEVVSGAETVLAGNDLSCATDTQSLTASASATAIDAVSADAYQDTITITVAPQ